MVARSRASATRQAIVLAARGLFARQGYEATTVREIGAACGLSDAAIYYHFDTKREIFESALVPGPIRVGGLHDGAFDVSGLIDDLFCEMDDWASQSELVSVMHRGVIQGDPEPCRRYVDLVDEFESRMRAGLEPHFGSEAVSISRTVALLFCGAFLEAVLHHNDALASALQDAELRRRLHSSLALCFPSTVEAVDVTAS